MLTKERINEIIRDAIIQVVGIDSIGENDNLLDYALGILPVYFIYIFDLISRQTELPVCKIFEQATFEVMTVHNLTEEIYKMQTRISAC